MAKAQSGNSERNRRRLRAIIRKLERERDVLQKTISLLVSENGRQEHFVRIGSVSRWSKARLTPELIEELRIASQCGIRIFALRAEGDFVITEVYHCG